MSTKKAKSSSDESDSGFTRPSIEDELHRIRELLELMEQHDLAELEIGPDGHSVRMSKKSAGFVAAPAAAMPVAPAPAAAPAASAPAETTEAAPADDPNLHTFLSPMVGTFYRQPDPEVPPYVVEGDTVQPDSTLCIIEAMKVFNEIHAGTTGKIEEILVDNGESVEYGKPLFTIRKGG